MAQDHQGYLFDKLTKCLQNSVMVHLVHDFADKIQPFLQPIQLYWLFVCLKLCHE